METWEKPQIACQDMGEKELCTIKDARSGQAEFSCGHGTKQDQKAVSTDLHTIKKFWWPKKLDFLFHKGTRFLA